MTQPFGMSNAATDEVTNPSLSVTGTPAPAPSGGVDGSAAPAGQQVTGTAKDQAREVLGETQRQTKNLLDQGRQELTQQAAHQHRRAASGLRSIGDELHGMANGAQQPGLATDLTREAAQRTEAIASWMEQREPGDLLQEVKTFARQRPVAFLAIAAGAGVLAGRLGRGLQADVSTTHPDVSTGVDTTPAYATTPTNQNGPDYGTPPAYETTPDAGTTPGYGTTPDFGDTPHYGNVPGYGASDPTIAQPPSFRLGEHR